MLKSRGPIHTVAAIGVFFLLLIAAGSPAVAAKKDKGGGELVRFDEVNRPRGEEDPERALIYVVRPATVGFAVKSYFFCDREILGINKGKSYFFAHVAPGKHVFWSKSENVDAIEMEVEAGKTYFLQQKPKMGFGKARTRLVVLEPDEGRERLEECKRHGTMTEKGRERGGRFADSHFEYALRSVERKAELAAKEDQ